MTLQERLSAKGPKRILALDGGGIRGALTVGFLERIERLLRERHRNPDLRLSDYFDLIGGTSTGAIIASALAIGMEAAEIKRMYLELGGKVFGKKMWRKWTALFDIVPLQAQLERVFGDITLGSSDIKTGLCIVTKRADTGSTWPLHNHPGGMYYEHNKDILLRYAIRASTAAPVYFIPEKFEVGKGEIGAFVDGGVSMANNPALQLFLMATLKGFSFRWPMGEDQLLLVSAGTGSHRRHDKVDTVVAGRVWNWALQVPAMLMEDASWQNQAILQLLSRSQTPWEIDSEIGDLREDLILDKPALSYLRYDVLLEPETLEQLGLSRLTPKLTSLREMSAAQNRHDLAKIGEEAAKQQVKEAHFPAAFDLPTTT
jgi:uncharacterized protein